MKNLSIAIRLLLFGASTVGIFSIYSMEHRQGERPEYAGMEQVQFPMPLAGGVTASVHPTPHVAAVSPHDMSLRAVVLRRQAESLNVLQRMQQRESSATRAAVNPQALIDTLMEAGQLFQKPAEELAMEMDKREGAAMWQRRLALFGMLASAGLSAASMFYATVQKGCGN